MLATPKTNTFEFVRSEDRAQDEKDDMHLAGLKPMTLSLADYLLISISPSATQF